MSRPAKRDKEFDKEMFSALLKEAQGSRAQQEFASAIPMSKTYLNGFLQCRKERPLMPGLLRKIASASQGRVCYEDLLLASGYNPELYVIPNPAVPPTTYTSTPRIMSSIICSNLMHAGFRWTVVPESDNDDFDMSITTEDPSIKKWGFIFLPDAPETITDIRRITYGRISEIKDIDQVKISIVTAEETTFHNLIDNPPHNISGFISVILLDMPNYNIMAEITLCQPSHIPQNCSITI